MRILTPRVNEAGTVDRDGYPLEPVRASHYRAAGIQAMEAHWANLVRPHLGLLTVEGLAYARIPTRIKLIHLMGALETDQLAGKRIINFGGGATQVRDGSLTFDGVAYHPWLNRLLTVLGANVVGVDYCESPGEPYRHVVGDFLKDATFAGLEDGSFDLACGFGLFGSPTLMAHSDLVTPYRQLRDRAVRLLKPQGVFLWDGLPE
jgi:hypothetical protein